MEKSKTFIYIDGFNLYYRLKHTPFKWLNLRKLANFYLHPQEHNIQTIKYFTARVQSSKKDPLKDTRQDIYLRAVKTLLNWRLFLVSLKKDR